MSSKNKRQKTRQLLVQALYQWQVAQATMTDVIAEFLTDNDPKKFDVEYFQEVFKGIEKNNVDIDEFLSAFISRSIKELDQVELAILRLGMYELIYKIDVPYKVVINEAVELSKRYGATESHKFVNGVLDKAAKKYREIEINK